MKISARNKLQGTVTSIKLGGVMAEVVVRVGENEIVSVVTRTSAESSGSQKATRSPRSSSRPR